MSLANIQQSYKSSDNQYIEGIETPHGRVMVVLDTILENIDKMMANHPKTDFIAYGKCLNSFTILSTSLDFEKGGDLAENLIELYDYCVRSLQNYLTEKNEQKLSEVYNIISTISDGWKQIKS